jgi:hypothetical protein
MRWFDAPMICEPNEFWICNIGRVANAALIWVHAEV